MAKQKGKRLPPEAVVQTFTRENVLALIAERNSLAAEAAGINAFVAKLRTYGLSETDIEEARSKMTSGNLSRLSYVEDFTRRAAFAILRAQGFNRWASIVEANVEMIPLAKDKMTREALLSHYGFSAEDEIEAEDEEEVTAE